jgi:hypothetical protein
VSGISRFDSIGELSEYLQRVISFPDGYLVESPCCQAMWRTAGRMSADGVLDKFLPASGARSVLA